MLYFKGINYSEELLKVQSPNMAFPSDQFYKEMCLGTTVSAFMGLNIKQIKTT